MRLKKYFVLFLVFLMLVSTVSFTEYTAEGKKKSEKPYLNVKKLEMKKGQTKKLKVMGTKKKVKWKSSNKKVATVTKKGTVKGKKAGKTKITGIIGEKKLVCLVRVNEKIKRTLPKPKLGDTRIRFPWDDKEIIVRLIDNEAAKNLVSKLPLSLRFEDYEKRQKTGVIKGGLDVGNAPGECDCFVGDVNYYAPWKMLTFFYHDFGYAPDLTPLGTVESGLKYLKKIDQGVVVTVSLVK